MEAGPLLSRIRSGVMGTKESSTQRVLRVSAVRVEKPLKKGGTAGKLPPLGRELLFSGDMMDFTEAVQYLLGTEKDVFFCPFPVSWGQEAVVVNCFSPGDTVVCVILGESGERWAKIAETFGLSVIRLGGYGGRPPAPEDLFLLFQTDRGRVARGVLVPHAEGTRGLWVDLGAFGKVCQSFGSLYAVDASESFGVFPLELDRSGVDVTVVGAPALPEHFSLLVVGERGWKEREGARCPRCALDFQSIQGLSRGQEIPSSFLERLGSLRGLGREVVWERRRYLASLFRKGAKILGFGVEEEENRFPSVTCLALPEGVGQEEVLAVLEEERVIAGRVPGMEGAVWVRHGDALVISEVLGILFALERVLAGKGQKVSVFTALAEMGVDVR